MGEFKEYRGKEWLFTDRLRDRKKDLGIKHDTDIYKSIQIDQRTYNKYKNGVLPPTSEAVFKLAVRLQCTSDYLFGLEELPTHEGTDVAKYCGLSQETIEQLHQLAMCQDEKRKDDSFRRGLDFIEFMIRDDEFQVHPTFNPKEETVGTIIKEAVESFNTYFRKKRSGKMDSQKDNLNHARNLLRNYGIKALYREEILEYYQQLLRKRIGKITDEWLQSMFDYASGDSAQSEDELIQQMSMEEIEESEIEDAPEVFEDTDYVVIPLPDGSFKKIRITGEEE